MMQPYKQILNWPNVLTLVRIMVIPLLVLLFYLPSKWSHVAAALVFTIAAITDWLDGYLARYLKQSTLLGAFLDPVADKLMVSIALVLIVSEPAFRHLTFSSFAITIPVPFLSIPAAIIVSREIIVSALREWMAEIGKRTSVAVSNLAKFKTAVQMLALIVLLYCDRTSHTALILSGYILLYIAAILTIWTMFIYLKTAWIQVYCSND